MTELLLIRHGETDWNRVRRVQGHTDIPLNDTGLAQARAAAMAVAAAHRIAPYQALMSSDLARARQTAAAIADSCGLPLQIDPDLRERNYGIFEGLTDLEQQATYPEMAARLYSGDPFFAPDKGESRVAFFERSITALTGIAQANPGARLIIVTHGGVLDCLWRAAHDTPLDAPRHWPLLNASLNTLAYRQERFVVLQWGDDAHLSLTMDE